MSLFGKKRTLDKVTFGELKMAEAELDYNITTTKASIAKTDEQINAALAKGKKVQSEFEMRALARETADLVSVKKDLLQRLETLQTKQRATQKLIKIKEEQNSPLNKGKDLFDEIDVDSIVKEQENAEVKAEMDKIKAEKVLRAANEDDSYDKILSIFKSVNLDDESVEVAKTEIDDIADIKSTRGNGL